MTTARSFFLEHAGRKVPVEDAEVLIGSAPDSTLVVTGKTVEPLVAVARREGDGVVLESRAREHEAKVNGKLLSVADLTPGTELRLGQVEMTVRGSGVDLTLESDEGTFPIKVGANLIGRIANAAVMVDHPTVSRKHALIFLLPNGQARVRHLGAQNGTFVDGVRLGQVELHQGDRIEIGDDQLFFFAGPEPAAEPAARSVGGQAESAGEADLPVPPDATIIAGSLPLPSGPPAAPPAASPVGPTFELTIDGDTRVLEPGTFVIGRTPECDLSFPDDALVSRRHTQLTVGDDRVRLRDLGSSNGTRVNGHRVEKEITLADGDRLEIGGAEILFRIIRPPDPYAATVLGMSPAAAAFARAALAADPAISAERPPAAGAPPAFDRAAALRSLDLPPDAGPDQVRERYRELYSDYQIRCTNAPTPELKQRYSRRLEELRQAVEALAPGASAAADPAEAADLPAARPVDTPLHGVRGAGHAAGTTGAAAAAASAPPASVAASPPASIPPAAGDDRAPGRGLPRSTWVMAGILLLLVAVTSAGALLYGRTAGVEGRRAAELAAKQQELAAMEQRIPAASQQFEQLQGVEGSALENHEVKICNLGSRPLFVEWLHASWVGPDGDFEEFDSAYFSYETWEIAPGGTGKFGYVSGDEVVWDGRAVFISALLAYAGEEYFRSGAVESLGVDCYNLDLDR